MSDCRRCAARSKIEPALPSRRGFFATLSALGFGLVALPKTLFAAGKPWVAVPLSKAPKLRNAGGSMVTKIRGKELLLIRDSENSAHAFEAKCPHEQCDLSYAPATQKVECPCHDALFDLSGKVLQGPPPRPLESYQAIVDGDRILLHIPEV
jgi:nitrite reductase/ring-hydroxylating ferredoxin subunit